MYFPGTALRLKLKILYARLSWTSKAGMEDTLQNPQAVLVHKFMLSQTHYGGLEGRTAWLLTRGVDPIRGLRNHNKSLRSLKGPFTTCCCF